MKENSKELTIFCWKGLCVCVGGDYLTSTSNSRGGGSSLILAGETQSKTNGRLSVMNLTLLEDTLL